MRFQSFEEMLSYWAERKENGPALIFDEHGKSSWTYTEFLRRVRERAEELRAGGQELFDLRRRRSI
jgi:acyl-CoA synthetase (AMP-forming)/AMP-acid ligase II